MKEPTDLSISLGRRTMPEEGFDHNWEPIELDNVKFSQDSTFFFCGGNTTTREDAANGNAKILETLIEPSKRKRPATQYLRTPATYCAGKRAPKAQLP